MLRHMAMKSKEAQGKLLELVQMIQSEMDNLVGIIIYLDYSLSRKEQISELMIMVELLILVKISLFQQEEDEEKQNKEFVKFSDYIVNRRDMNCLKTVIRFCLSQLGMKAEVLIV